LISKLLNQIYRIPRLIALLFESPGHRQGQLSSAPKVALFASGMHFQELTSEGLILSKAENWITVLQKACINSETILNPFSVRPKEKTARPLFSIEYLILQAIIGFIRHGQWNWIIDECDPQRQLLRTLKNKICVQIYYEFLRRNDFRIIAGVALKPELCVVTSFLKLPTYEFQHGAATAEELEVFGRFTTSPNFLFVWDEHYSKGRPNENSLINIGYPKDFRNQKRRNIHLDETRPLSILVSMSYGDLNSVDTTGLLNKSLCDPIEMVLARGHEVRLRFHPAVFTGLEISRRDAQLVTRFLDWKAKHVILRQAVMDQHNNLCDSLENSDLHFSFASSTIIEAAYCGVTSILFCSEIEAPNIPPLLYSSGLVRHYREGLFNDQILKISGEGSVINIQNEKLFLEIVKGNL
jgi:hypothetical protein